MCHRGGFGGEGDADEDGDGPHPLDGEGDAVGPFVGAFEEGGEDAGGDELAEDPAEVLGCVSLIEYGSRAKSALVNVPRRLSDRRGERRGRLLRRRRSSWFGKRPMGCPGGSRRSRGSGESARRRE